MNYTTKSKITIDVTVDSSEAVMFTKGGKHEMTLPRDLFLDDFDEAVITFQLERNEQGRFNHVFGEGQKHREQWDKINEEQKKLLENLKAKPHP